MRSLSACLICLCASFSTSAGAQANAPVRPAVPPGTVPPGPMPAGTMPAGSNTATPGASQAPAGTPATSPAPTGSGNPANPGAGVASPNSGMPEVNDPMLTPVEAAPQVLSTWQQALALVRSRSTSVAIAQSRVVAAQGRARQALASTLPNLSGNASMQRSLLFGTSSRDGFNQRFPASSTVWGAGVQFSQTLLDLRTWHDVGTARSTVEAAQVSAEDAERLALGALADTIVTVITAERLAEVSRVSLRSNLSTLDLTKKRTLLGAASAVDVLRAEQEVATTRANVVQSDETLRQAREALGMALGYPEAWGVAADIKVDQLASDARSVCTPIQDPEERSDVRAARLNVRVSERNTESPSYGLAPRLTLGSGLNYNSAPNSPRPVDWSISAVLSVPIYDGGELGAERDINRATTVEARQTLTQTARQARLQAVQAQRSIQVAQANFDVSRQARDIAAESARLSRIAFVHGTGTSFDLVDAARRQREAEIDVTIKEFEVVRAQITALLALSNCNI